MSFDLTGRRALVSGASRGIGRAIAAGLAQAGADVAGLARNVDAMTEIAAEIERLDRRYVPIAGDVRDTATIPGLVQAALDALGGIDVLVNAAGIIVREDPLATTAAAWDDTFATNVRGAFFLTQAVGERMLARGGGTVVNIASLAGEVVTGAPVSYQASKAALIQMTRALAVRWAPTVRVNAVGPGYVRTDLNREWFSKPENEQYVADRTPLGRPGVPAEVVGSVVFLASDAAAYVTGQHLRVDGGWSAQ